MENRNEFLEMDGLYWESETHEWFHDKTSTQYARTDNGLNKDALPNIYCFVVRNKENGEYDRVVMDAKTNEVIYSTKVLEDLAFFIDKLKVAKDMMKDDKEVIDNFSEFMKFYMSMQGFGTIFGGIPFLEKEKSPYEELGNGYELRPIEILTEGSQFVVENNDKFSNLYHNGLKVSDEVFRKGGVCNGFKEGYCNLIHYVKESEHTLKRHGFSYGTHVLINELGDIVLSLNGLNETPYHLGGNVGTVKNNFYNLKTGDIILSADTAGIINGRKFAIVNHRYEWYDKENKFPVGVYKIDKETCEVVKIDDIH